jgi:hypothetical protein
MGNTFTTSLVLMTTPRQKVLIYCRDTLQKTPAAYLFIETLNLIFYCFQKHGRGVPYL